MIVIIVMMTHCVPLSLCSARALPCLVRTLSDRQQRRGEVLVQYLFYLRARTALQRVDVAVDHGSELSRAASMRANCV